MLRGTFILFNMRAKRIHFHIITLFPEIIEPYLKTSILGRAEKDKKIKVSFYNPRDFSEDKHKSVDDKPYGGGPGMVIQARPVLAAAKSAIDRKKNVVVIFFTPSGTAFDQKYANRLVSGYDHIVLIAGHYEGIDERVALALRARKVSIGPYTLTGGELPATILVDAVSREIKGVLGNEYSRESERDASPKVYTRPEVITYKNKKYSVPKVLLSGDHKKIEQWRKNNC
jgi:tRNA (guanine37-N1)-methyltransferase